MFKYTEAFCPVDKYRCLMPVEYEQITQNAGVNTYKKSKCNCYHVREGRCNNGMVCDHFLAAEEIIEQ